MKIASLIALFLFVSSTSHSAAIGSRGGKKAVLGINDASGNDLLVDDDKPWKVFESTQIGRFQVVDESGVSPKQGTVRQVCISSVIATTEFIVAYDSNTTAGVNSTIPGIRLGPPFVGSTTKASCLQLNALFTSGLVIEVSTQTGAGSSGSGYVYWRELGAYK